MKNSSFYLPKLTGILALFSLPSAIFANIIIDADVPATMNTSGNQYIVGSAGPFERDLGSTTVTVGNSNPDVSLVIQNGGVLSNGVGRIGNGSGSNGNSVIVTGSGSTWNNSGDFYVGVSGSNNSMVVSDGATVSSGWVRVGHEINSTGNSVTITGAGTTWTSSSFNVGGELGSGNSLIISDGATVMSSSGRIGRGLGASNNHATVTGTGSTWSNNQTSMSSANSSITISAGGSINTGEILMNASDLAITMSGGATLSSTYLYAGAGVQNANITVSGTGTVWDNDLYISLIGINGSLWIDDGASVYTQENLTIGQDSSNGNSATVEGAGSILSVSNNISFATGGGTDNTLVIRDGALASVDGNISFYDLGGSFDNFLRFDGGFLAWQGDQTEGITNFLDLEFIQVWNGEEWVTATSETLIYSFFADDASALAFSGYDDLGGYTIVTAIAVPEPSLFAMLLGSIAGGFICIRRMRRIS